MLRNFKNACIQLLFLVISSCFICQPVIADETDDWFIAVQNDYDSKIKDMLEHGFNPNTVESKRGDTGLILAMREDSNRVMDVLLADSRTKLDSVAFNGDNALMIACYRGNEKAVKALLKKGAKVNKNGWTPLHYAAANGNNTIVKMLLIRDAFVNAASPNGTTPVMMAANGGHIYTVKLLYENGADLTITNQQKLSAIDFANMNQNTKIAEGIQYLIEKEERMEKIRNTLPLFPF